MLFSKAMELCYNFLTKDLADFAGGVYNAMRMVNIGFQAFSYAFLLLLTLWNMIRQSLSWEQLKRPEVLIKFLVRYIATTYVTLSSWNIVTSIMTIVGALITRAFTSAGFGGGNIWAGMATPSFTDSFTSLIGSALTVLTGGLNILPALLMYLLLFCVAVVVAVKLLLTVVGRFFKIYLLTAVSPLPLACFGAESTESIAKNYLRTFAGVALEGLVIGLAMIVFSGYAQNPLIVIGDLGLFSWIGSYENELTYMVEQIFNMLLLQGIVNGADQLVHQIFS